MTHHNLFNWLALSVSLTVGVAGCSISNSAGSLSDSSGSFAKSSGTISGSSKSSTEESETAPSGTRYEREVTDFTVTYVRTSAASTDRKAFMKGISDIASQQGIVDWEANPKTYRAIGAGLKKAKLNSSQFETYKKQLANYNRSKMSDIQEGYDSKD